MDETKEPLTVMRVKDGETRDAFLERAKSRLAADGDMFDYATWLEKYAYLSLDQMSDPSWVGDKMKVKRPANPDAPNPDDKFNV